MTTLITPLLLPVSASLVHVSFVSTFWSPTTPVRFFSRPIHAPRPSFLCSLISRNSDPGSHILVDSSPPPTAVNALYFYREEGSAPSSLVDSRRIDIRVYYKSTLVHPASHHDDTAATTIIPTSDNGKRQQRKEPQRRQHQQQRQQQQQKEPQRQPQQQRQQQQQSSKREQCLQQRYISPSSCPPVRLKPISSSFNVLQFNSTTSSKTPHQKESRRYSSLPSLALPLLIQTPLLA